MDSDAIVFNAVSSSVRQLFLLLRAIHFTPKAHVTITETGLHFLAEDSRVMQGSVLLGKDLFSSYVFHPPLADPQRESGDISNEEQDEGYVFQITFPALLETLQILGLTDPSQTRSTGFQDNFDSGVTTLSRGGASSAFDHRVLGTAGICRLSYSGPGSPLKVVLEEGNVTTTCALTTYESGMQQDGDIPLQRDALILKIIMRSSLLFDAVLELESTSPSRLMLEVSPTSPNLVFSATGSHSSASVELSHDKQLLETFQCSDRASNSYKYNMVKGASRAMALADKVSIRTDRNGVLSLQFLVDGTDGAEASFVDFRFAALVDEVDD